MIKESLSKICPEDAVIHPIKLNQLTFLIFTCYFQTFSKCVKHSADAVVLEAMADQDGTPEKEGQVGAARMMIHLGPGSYAATCALLSHLFTKLGPQQQVL